MNTQFYINEGLNEFFAIEEEFNSFKKDFIKGQYIFDEECDWRFWGDDIFETPSFWNESDIINFTLVMLSHYGYDMTGFAGKNGTEIQMLAEMSNWAAKEDNPSFYKLKPTLIVIAAKNGAQWSNNGETFSLYSPEIGVSSFHDPMGEVEELIKEIKIPAMEAFEWSGIIRQYLAHEIIRSYVDGGFIHKAMAYLTKPGKVLNHSFSRRVEKHLENA